MCCTAYCLRCVVVIGVYMFAVFFFFFFQAEDGIRDTSVTGVQTCALPILMASSFFHVARDIDAGIPRDDPRIRAAEQNLQRSEERRVGKECRSRWAPDY